MSRLLLGIDLGTSGVKACVIRDDCTVVSTGEGRYPTYYPRAQYAEQDAEQWWSAAVQAIRQAVGRAAGQGQIAGISVSSHSPSLLPVDKNGKPLRNAMIWMDRRATRECAYLAHELIGLDRYKRILGANPDPYYVLPKLYWYKHNEPENYKKTYKILQTNGYINFRLTGSYSIDEVHAISVQGMDIRTSQWSDEISGLVDIPIKDLFPPISRCHEIVGTVSKRAASETGLPEGVPVVAGVTDTLAAYLGFGVPQPGLAAEMTGTSSLLYFPVNRRLTDGGTLLVKPSPVGDGTVLVAPVSTVGASVNWFAEMVGRMDQPESANAGKLPFDVMNAEAEQAKAGSGGLIYFPYLAGERAPLWNSHAKGMFIGLSLKTTRLEMIRSIYEGTSYAIRHNFDEAAKLGVVPDTVYAAGGGAKSEIWLKIKASVLNKPLLVLEEHVDRAAFGDCLLAGYGTHLFREVDRVARDAVSVAKTVEPDPEWVKVYNEIYPYYIRMYQHLDHDLASFESAIKSLAMI